MPPDAKWQEGSEKACVLSGPLHSRVNTGLVPRSKKDGGTSASQVIPGLDPSIHTAARIELWLRDMQKG